MDYEKWRAAFVGISHLSDAKDLDEALPGRLKYDPQTHEPLAFEGTSVIHNVDGVTAKRLGLSALVDKVISQLRSADLNTKIAFVSTDSFHATTFDLINEGEHGEKLAKAGQNYSTVRRGVEQETLRLLTESGLRLTAPVRVTGLGMFAPKVLKLNLNFSDLLIETFHGFRVALHRHLIQSVPGYSIVRGPDWDGKLAGHITFGYVVKPLVADEIDRFLSVVKDFNGSFQPLVFELTQGEVTRFTDMDHYSAVGV
jgi:hypothetical protein